MLLDDNKIPTTMKNLMSKSNETGCGYRDQFSTHLAQLNELIACQQHSLNAIFHRELQKYSVKIFAIIDRVYLGITIDAFWDTF